MPRFKRILQSIAFLAILTPLSLGQASKESPADKVSPDVSVKLIKNYFTIDLNYQNENRIALAGNSRYFKQDADEKLIIEPLEKLSPAPNYYGVREYLKPDAENVPSYDINPTYNKSIIALFPYSNFPPGKFKTKGRIIIPFYENGRASSTKAVDVKIPEQIFEWTSENQKELDSYIESREKYIGDIFANFNQCDANDKKDLMTDLDSALKIAEAFDNDAGFKSLKAQRKYEGETDMSSILVGAVKEAKEKFDQHSWYCYPQFVECYNSISRVFSHDNKHRIALCPSYKELPTQDCSAKADRAGIMLYNAVALSEKVNEYGIHDLVQSPWHKSMNFREAPKNIDSFREYATKIFCQKDKKNSSWEKPVANRRR